MEREETMVTRPCQQEPLHNLHATPTLALSRGRRRPRVKDRGVVVLSQLLAGAVDSSLIAANRCNAGLRLSQTTALGTPPIMLKALTCAPIRSAGPSDQRASA